MQRCGRLRAGLTGTSTARLNEGHQVDPTQSGSGVRRAEQPASWHIGVRLTAGWRAVVTAGGLEEADLVWAGAGQADSAPTEFVRGADGGGGAGGDTAAVGSTASHGVRDWVVGGLRREVSLCLDASVFSPGSYIPTSQGVSLLPRCFPPMFQFIAIAIKSSNYLSVYYLRHTPYLIKGV